MSTTPLDKSQTPATYNYPFDPDSGATALHWAAQDGRISALRKIWADLPKGANPNPPDLNGDTPLHWATDSGCKASVQAILEHLPKDTPSHLQNHRGQTPLHLAARGGHTSIARFLLKHFPPDVPDQHGQTSLHIAAHRDRSEMVQMFINALKKTGQIHTLWMQTNASKRTPRQCASPGSLCADILAEAEKSAIQEIQKIGQKYIFGEQVVGCEAKILELITDYMT